MSPPASIDFPAAFAEAPVPPSPTLPNPSTALCQFFSAASFAVPSAQGLVAGLPWTESAARLASRADFPGPMK